MDIDVQSIHPCSDAWYMLHVYISMHVYMSHIHVCKTCAPNVHATCNIRSSLHVSDKCGDTAEREHGVGGRAVVQREVLSQLQQLECQLSAIENTARTVQGELLASNQVPVHSTYVHLYTLFLHVHVHASTDTHQLAIACSYYTKQQFRPSTYMYTCTCSRGKYYM